MAITVVLGSIVDIRVDCIVNAAKPSLLGGGGVDGAIHAAAGPELRIACRSLNGCLPGKAVVTEGYQLAATYVIHTVGPRYGACGGKEEEILRSCYTESLRLASERGVTSIAFPSIGTGAYGFPKKDAARIAVSAIQDALSTLDIRMDIVLVVVSEEDKSLVSEALNRVR